MSDPVSDLKRELLAAAERQLEHAELGSAGVARKSRRRWLERFHAQGRRRRLVVLAAAALLVVVTATSAFAARAFFVDKGIIGLAPVGATPSTPEEGELVLDFMFGHTRGDFGRFSVFMYADGRLIWQRLGDYSHADAYSKDYSSGFLERRLTPEGVELVRAKVISTGLVDHDLHLRGEQGLYFGRIEFKNGDRRVHVTWGNDIGTPYSEAGDHPTPEQARALEQLDARLADPTSWLPGSAWEDLVVRPYVPSRYSACYGGEQGVGLSRILASLPPAAEDMLRTQDIRQEEYTNLSGTFVYWCSGLTNDEARELARVLDHSGLNSVKSGLSLSYGDSGAQSWLDIAPHLPHNN